LFCKNVNNGCIIILPKLLSTDSSPSVRLPSKKKIFYLLQGFVDPVVVGSFRHLAFLIKEVQNTEPFLDLKMDKYWGENYVWLLNSFNFQLSILMKSYRQVLTLINISQLF